MNAGGHGSDMAAVLGEGPRRRSGQREGCRGVGHRPRSRLPPLVDRPDRPRRVGRARARARATRPTPRRRSRRSCAGVGRTSPAVRTPGRCSRTRPDDSAGRLIDETGLQGLPRRHARACRRSTPTSSRPTTVDRPPTCSRSCRWSRCGSVIGTASSCSPRCGWWGSHDRGRRGGAAAPDGPAAPPASHRGAPPGGAAPAPPLAHRARRARRCSRCCGR